MGHRSGATKQCQLIIHDFRYRIDWYHKQHGCPVKHVSAAWGVVVAATREACQYKMLSHHYCCRPSIAVQFSLAYRYSLWMVLLRPNCKQLKSPYKGYEMCLVDVHIWYVHCWPCFTVHRWCTMQCEVWYIIICEFQKSAQPEWYYCALGHCNKQKTVFKKLGFEW